ncbi:metallophosphoesterase [Pseudooceanicola sp. LIPI14-2-Ac024]|uniref:metallophosphoesterase n=1 Tax=Pseudooceanicola sp. LIPI14-2-Ac024 TaxID=3344875 RepID=UPI0035D03D12
MPTRRDLLHIALSLPLLPSALRAAEIPLRFGVIADPQYADAPPKGTRHYAASLGKLAQAIDVLNEADLHFVATLGDFIDHDFASFDPVRTTYQKLYHRHFAVLGNHDYAVAPELRDRVPGRLGMTGTYYDVLGDGWRVIVLDGNEVSTFTTAPGTDERAAAEAKLASLEARDAPNAKPWNGGISEAQFDWLRDRLDTASDNGERVIVMGHYPLTPDGDQHLMWDAERVRDLLVAQKVPLYLCGHNHAGGHQQIEGTHFLTLCGMVETADQTAFAMISLYPDRIEVEGHGREPDRRLPL